MVIKTVDSLFSQCCDVPPIGFKSSFAEDGMNEYACNTRSNTGSTAYGIKLVEILITICELQLVFSTITDYCMY